MMPLTLDEQQVIGACFMSRAAARECATVLDVQDMDSQDGRAIWGVILEAVESGGPIAEHVVGEKSGVGFLECADATAACATDANAGFYAQRIADRAALGRARMRLRRGLQAIDEGGDLTLVASLVGDVMSEQHGRVAAGVEMTDLMARPDSDVVEWVIPGLLARGERLCLTGAEGLGKTTLARQIAISAANGAHPLTAADIEPVKVLILDAENSEAQWGRTSRRMWETARLRRPDVAPQCRLVAADAGLVIDLLASPAPFVSLVAQARPDLLIVGPLYRLASESTQAEDVCIRVLAALDSARREAGCAVILEAHSGHGRDTDGVRQVRPAGSSALLRWPEVGIGIRQSETDAHCVDVVRWRGDRESREWPARLARGTRMPWVAEGGF